MRTWTQTLLLALLAFSAAPAHSVDFTERLIDTSTSTKSEAWSASGSITSSGHLDAVSVSNVESPVEGDLVQLASGEIVTSIDASRLTGTSNRTQRLNVLFDDAGSLQSATMLGPSDASRPLKGLLSYAQVAPLQPATISPVQLKNAPAAQQFKEDGTEKAPEPEQSFIQKYWMYLIPLAIFMLTASASPPPEESKEKKEQ